MIAEKMKINKNTEWGFRFTTQRFNSFASFTIGGTLMDCHDSILLE